MKIRIAGWICPYLLFYSDNLPDGVGGRTQLFVVRIRPAYKDDIGIEKHEAEHVRQFWNLPLIDTALYGWWAGYRQWAEIAAYKVQLKYSPDQLLNFAQRMTEMYNLKITKEEALKLLGG